MEKEDNLQTLKTKAELDLIFSKDSNTDRYTSKWIEVKGVSSDVICSAMYLDGKPHTITFDEVTVGENRHHNSISINIKEVKPLFDFISNILDK